MPSWRSGGRVAGPQDLGVGVLVGVRAPGVAGGVALVYSDESQPMRPPGSRTRIHRRPPSRSSSPSGDSRVPSVRPVIRSPPLALERRMTPSRPAFATQRRSGRGVRDGVGGGRGELVGKGSSVGLTVGRASGVIPNARGSPPHAMVSDPTRRIAAALRRRTAAHPSSARRISSTDDRKGGAPHAFARSAAERAKR